MTLFDAIEQGDLGQVWKLVHEKKGLMDSDEETGLTPLALAAELGLTEVVRLLIAAEVDPNHGGVTTPLESAVLEGNPEVVEILLAAGADANQPVAEGFTPLMTAATTGNRPIAMMLLHAGARPRARNEEDETAIDVATREGFDDLVRELRTFSHKRHRESIEEEEEQKRQQEEQKRQLREERRKVREAKEAAEEKERLKEIEAAQKQALQDAEERAAESVREEFNDEAAERATRQVRRDRRPEPGRRTTEVRPAAAPPAAAPPAAAPPAAAQPPVTPPAAAPPAAVPPPVVRPADTSADEASLRETLFSDDFGQDENTPATNPSELEGIEQFRGFLAIDDRESCRQMVENKAFDLEAHDSSGQSALMLAAAHGAAEVVATLLEAGVEVDAQESQETAETALVKAINHATPERIDVITLLVEAGADLERHHGTSGMTPLMYAATADVYIDNQHSMIFGTTTKHVIKLGANLEVKDHRGNTVWRLIKRNAMGALTSSPFRRRLVQMLKVLEHAGAEQIASHMV